jgi:hypothetical protein
LSPTGEYLHHRTLPQIAEKKRLVLRPGKFQNFGIHPQIAKVSFIIGGDTDVKGYTAFLDCPDGILPNFGL